jgi:hypothetical protein
MLSVGITANPAVIAAGQSLSLPTAMGALTLVGISMPAVWTAAPLTFQVSPDGGTTWQELYYDSGVEVSIAAAVANVFIVSQALPSYLWRGINYVKIRSGTLAAPVVQAAGAVINIMTRSEML